MRAIILAVDVGKGLKPQMDASPKCLLELGGKTLLRRYLDALAALHVADAVCVVGHLKEQVKAEAAHGPAGLRVRFIENDKLTRGNILSLWHARDEFDDDILVMDSDLLFPREMLARLLASADQNTIAVDERFQDTGKEQKVLCEDGWLVEVTKKVNGKAPVCGAAVGVLRLSAEAAEVLRGILEEFVNSGMDSLEYQDAFRELAVEVPISIVQVGDLPWIDIDVQDDLARARDEILPRIERLDRGEALPTP
ncbi:MAG TPA: phosphocholine cytidylyltransferase family protein [Candidatus Sulfotelmatobacter sp.]|nr:phosphocholine cytidylyltransferase family protein [Candidatus Sulfotelmatobacter sp.]